MDRNGGYIALEVCAGSKAGPEGEVKERGHFLSSHSTWVPGEPSSPGRHILLVLTAGPQPCPAGGRQVQETSLTPPSHPLLPSHPPIWLYQSNHQHGCPQTGEERCLGRGDGALKEDTGLSQRAEQTAAAHSRLGWQRLPGVLMALADPPWLGTHHWRKVRLLSMPMAGAMCREILIRS